MLDLLVLSKSLTLNIKCEVGSNVFYIWHIIPR